MYMRILLLATFCVFCKGQSDPYDDVGPCYPRLLKYRIASFNISDLVNSGPYTFINSTGLSDVKCASTAIYGDQETTLRGSTTVITTDGVSTKTSYALSQTEKGILKEVLNVTDSNGKITSYEFKLIVKMWKPQYGLLYFVRCSKNGRNTNADSRSIVVNECQINNKAVLKLAALWARYDKLYHLDGNMAPIPQCDSS